MINYNVDNLHKGLKLEVIKKEIEMHKYAASLGDMIKRVKSEPRLEMIYSGIKEKSVGVVFGPSKSGKTMYCENLGMSIAAGANNYLGLPINMDERKVLFISFEEYYAYRTERNFKQVIKLAEQYGADWVDNFVVVNEDIPRYIITKDHWQDLADLINNIEPNIVFLDSLTHMYQGSIEDSKVAVELTKNLRGLSEDTGATIAAIHHTHKMYGQQLSIDTIAGSRVIAQELDFMIGLNRTPNGKKYIKDVAFRYIPSNDGSVKTFEIDNNCWLNITGEIDEMKLLSAPDGRRDDANLLKIKDFIVAQNEAGIEVIPFKMIEENLVAIDGGMSKQTAISNLQKLVDENSIIKPAKGVYKLAA